VTPFASSSPLGVASVGIGIAQACVDMLEARFPEKSSAASLAAGPLDPGVVIRHPFFMSNRSAHFPTAGRITRIALACALGGRGLRVRS
jgi:hypothetical protein